MKWLGAVLWLVLVAALIFSAQRIPPREQMLDPSAAPGARPGIPGGWIESLPVGRGASRSDSTISLPSLLQPCATCRGQRVIDCPTCLGTGQTESVTTHRCEQCDGSGVYRSRISAERGVPCPFCRGTGNIEIREVITCPQCNGTGKIPCSTCQGDPEAP